MPPPERRWWLRFESEASACPACRSSRIRLLDVFSIPRTPERRRLAFISGCRSCGLLFVNPLPTTRQLKKYYSEQGTWATLKDERVKEGKSREPRPRRPDLLLSALERHVPQLASGAGRVLDFGCGDGKFLNRLKARGWQTYGIEPSSDAAFREHCRLTDVPQDRSFDFVVLNHVLEHLRDPLDTLQRLAGSLRDGGILFLSTPRLDTLPQHRDLKYCLSGHRHVVSFSETCLRGLLARAGFETLARIDSQELDDAFTGGQPLRLRLVAARTSHPPGLPVRPLLAALRALGAYAAAEHGVAGLLRRYVPVRFRAALIEAKMNQQFADKKRQVTESVTRHAGG
jgi:SAM-dependent methyltransferase